MWKGKIRCSICFEINHFTKDDITYADLRSPRFFVPDFQYYVECVKCGHKVIVTDVPSEHILEIQQRGLQEDV